MERPSDGYLTGSTSLLLARPSAIARVPLTGWILLVIVVAAIGYVVLRGPSVRRPKNRVATPTPTPSDDDLSSFGLSEVRVATKRSDAEEPARPPAWEEPVARPAPPPVPEMTARPVARPVAPPPPARREEPARLRPGTSLWDDGDPAAGHLLASLAAHVGGTAAVLRYDGGAYVVEALAGGEGARPDPIAADGCPLHRVPQDRMLTALPKDLGGLAALVDADRAYARALAEPPAERTFLVVGTDDRDGDPEALAQIERYADLLTSITRLEAPEPPETPAVPRAVLIREEQEAAREAGRPLAFALVTLAEAEDLLEAGGPALSQADAALHGRLAEAPSVHRVEPFGDLLVGAFLDLTPEAMAEWCTDLAASDPPLFIGAVAPAEGAPEAVRDAAAEALHDAYDQRRAQIVAA